MQNHQLLPSRASALATLRRFARTTEHVLATRLFTILRLPAEQPSR
ncbi:MAG: hypothetical protein ACTHU0_19335 [Kofleriaceae bacterium]